MACDVQVGGQKPCLEERGLASPVIQLGFLKNMPLQVEFKLKVRCCAFHQQILTRHDVMELAYKEALADMVREFDVAGFPRPHHAVKLNVRWEYSHQSYGALQPDIHRLVVLKQGTNEVPHGKEGS